MGKSSDPPPAPDYTGLAKQQADAQASLLNKQTVTNRPNQTTPWGSSAWTNSPSVNQSGYDQALASWNSGNAQGTWVPEIQGSWTGTAGPNGDGSYSPGSPGHWSGATSNGAKRPGLADFTTDNWQQDITLDPAEQRQLDSQRNIQSNFDQTATGLLGQVQNSMSKPLDFGSLPPMTSYDTSQMVQSDPNSIKRSDFSGLPALTGYDISKLTGFGPKLEPGFGAVEQVRDAMMSRMQPLRQQQRDREIQRLRNQGLSDNTEAFQRALTRLDQGDTDANQQALLGATSAYGDIFNRGLSANNQLMAQRAQQFGEQGQIASLAGMQRQQLGNEQNTQFNQSSQIQNMLQALRGQQFGEQGSMASLSGLQRQQLLGEQDMQRQSPLNDLMKLQGKAVSNPNMPSFVQAGMSQAPDYMGAANNSYEAAMQKYNAEQASSDGMMKGLFGLGGAALGNPAIGAGLMKFFG